MFRTTMLLISTIVFATYANAVVKVEKTEYKGWKNCYRVTNGEIELIVTGLLQALLKPRRPRRRSY